MDKYKQLQKLLKQGKTVLVYCDDRIRLITKNSCEYIIYNDFHSSSEFYKSCFSYYISYSNYFESFRVETTIRNMEKFDHNRQIKILKLQVIK